MERWIKIYDGADGVSPALCDRATKLFELSDQKHKLNQPWQRYHQLTRLHQTEIFEEVRESVARIFARYKRDVACATLNYVSRIEAPSLSRYDVADADGEHHFHSHADAWSMDTASRQVSVIVYLNDVEAGGETVFNAGLSVEPRQGRVLVFPSSLTFEHRGNPPRSGPKYVLVSWLHFEGTGHAYTTLPLFI